MSNKLLLWVISYFENRSQYVKVGAAKSDQFTVLSGVGQGTILGSLWFTVFVDDSNSDVKNVFHMNFADDKQIAVLVGNASTPTYYNNKSMVSSMFSVDELQLIVIFTLLAF